MEVNKRKTGKELKSSTVVYLDLDLLKRVSQETKETILHKVKEMGCKVYTSNNATDILRYKKPTVYRFGIIPVPVASRLSVRGVKVIPGDF